MEGRRMSHSDLHPKESAEKEDYSKQNYSEQRRRIRRSMRRGRGVLIAGMITAPLCALGVPLIIAGFAVLGASARRMRRTIIEQRTRERAQGQ
jgi:hypothetical protein